MHRRSLPAIGLAVLLALSGCQAKVTYSCADPDLVPKKRIVKAVTICRCIPPGEKWSPMTHKDRPKCIAKRAGGDRRG